MSDLDRISDSLVQGRGIIVDILHHRQNRFQHLNIHSASGSGAAGIAQFAPIGEDIPILVLDHIQHPDYDLDLELVVIGIVGIFSVHTRIPEIQFEVSPRSAAGRSRWCW